MKLTSALAALLVVAQGLGWAQTETPNESQTQTPATVQQERALPDWSLDYGIQPGDVIRVIVWREEALTGDHTVRLDGHVTLPLLGDVKASGRHPRELASELRESFAVFLERPIVTVELLEARNARFFVIGEVAVSGTFPLFGRTTVVQGLALAGGFQEFAKKSQIIILRFDGDTQVSIPFNYDEVEKGQRLEQNITILPGDTIVVP